MKVLLLTGGLSSEREVSLRSAQAVRSALVQNGHQVVEYDPANGLAKLDQYIGEVDVAFPVLHGKHGEDGEIQQALESIRLPYVGANSAVSRLCFNKYKFNQTIFERGFIIPLSQYVDWSQFLESKLIQKPYILKPVDGGSSIDTLIVTQPDNAANAASELFKKHPRLLLQELITGVEITVGILDQQALPAIEIIPPSGEDFDYQNKYNGRTQELCPPISINKEVQALAQRIALDIHQQLGVRHYSRTDMIVDQHNAIYVLELNTIPGLTEASLYPKAAQAAGYGMDQLVEKLINLAIN